MVFLINNTHSNDYHLFLHANQSMVFIQLNYDNVFAIDIINNNECSLSIHAAGRY